MTNNRELLIARLAELDTASATQLDLEVCYYERARAFYDKLSDPALTRLGEAINYEGEHHDQQ